MSTGPGLSNSIAFDIHPTKYAELQTTIDKALVNAVNQRPTKGKGKGKDGGKGGGRDQSQNPRGSRQRKKKCFFKSCFEYEGDHDRADCPQWLRIVDKYGRPPVGHMGAKDKA